MKTRKVSVPLVAAWLLAGCGDNNLLPEPIFENVVDTTVLYALSASELGTPSGFDVIAGRAARPELGEFFDFIVDFEGAVPVLKPAQAVGVTLESAFVTSERAFDAILEAPVEDYESDSTLVLTDGLVFIMRSRVNRQSCSIFLNLPHYGKFRFLGSDQTTGSITFEHVVNRNCGYRDLNLGLPRN